MAKNSAKDYSVVIPVFNEEEVLESLYARLTRVCEKLAGSYEIIFVDDGSEDGSLALLKELHGRDGRIKIVQLSRNFGHQIALTAGLDSVSGDVVMVMDADLQDPPEVLPQFIEKWREGYDVVYAIRKERKEGVLKRAGYKLFYRGLRGLADIDIPLDTGDFCVMDRRVVSLLGQMPERRRFIRGIRSWVGLKQIGLEVERDRRYAGEAKYSLGKLWALAIDGVLSFSLLPLRMVTCMGLVISAFSLLCAVGLMVLKLSFGIPLQGWTSLAVAVLFLGGIQTMGVGIVGEYVGRIYDEVRQRPLYVVGDKIGFGERE